MSGFEVLAFTFLHLQWSAFVPLPTSRGIRFVQARNTAPKTSISPRMLRATCAAALIFASLLSGCSGKRSVSNEKLKSAATEIVSIASEGELFAVAADENRAPTRYARGHPEYLRKQAQDVVKELAPGRREFGGQDQVDQLRQAATRLVEILDALPATAGDPRWQQTRSELDNIRRNAEEIRRTF
jgi:hypothetical protein